MKVVITGGAGFLGQRLARKLLERGRVAGAHGDETIDQLVLVDTLAVTGFDDPRVEVVAGDIADPALLARVIDARTTSVFHLAAVVSGRTELTSIDQIVFD